MLIFFSTSLRAAESGQTVPPKGENPFDPKPLMAKLEARITAGKYRFAVLGDTKHASTFPALVKYLDETVKPDFVLTTGDMVQSGGGEVGVGYYEKLSMDTGPAMRKRPWWPAIGNHELAGDPITGRDALVPEAKNASIQQHKLTGVENFKRFYNLEREYYSFAFRNAVFIALPFRYPLGESEQWLESELKKASEAKKLIFVFNHVPFYTVGSKSRDEISSQPTSITKLFEKYRVMAVFSGHDHGYYRTIRGGIPYITSAGGGAQIYPALRRAEALPEDIWYYAAPGANSKYILHRGAGQPDRITDKPDQFTVVVDVDGNHVTAFCVTEKGEKWDEVTLKQ